MRHLDLNLALEYLSLNQITGQTDGKYLQYLTVFTHEITGAGNIADLWENGEESLKPKEQQHPPAAPISSHIFSGLFENLTQTPYQD